jgi:putative transposase
MSMQGFICSDNGPEFTAKAVRYWLERLGVQTLFIESGSPWENGYNESFNWRKEYNQIRPHSSLGYRPPAPEAIQPVKVEILT